MPWKKLPQANNQDLVIYYIWKLKKGDSWTPLWMS